MKAILTYNNVLLLFKQYIFDTSQPENNYYIIHVLVDPFIQSYHLLKPRKIKSPCEAPRDPSSSPPVFIERLCEQSPQSQKLVFWHMLAVYTGTGE